MGSNRGFVPQADCSSGHFEFLDFALVVRKNGFSNGRGLVLCLCIRRVIDLIIIIVHITQ
jgi:hypothetical protein